jgi:hypothetical protein
MNDAIPRYYDANAIIYKASALNGAALGAHSTGHNHGTIPQLGAWRQEYGYVAMASSAVGVT